MIMVESLYMKTLVTHINPHLDDIAAIWLFKKYHPDFKDAKIEFISASRDAAQKEEEHDATLYQALTNETITSFNMGKCLLCRSADDQPFGSSSEMV